MELVIEAAVAPIVNRSTTRRDSVDYLETGWTQPDVRGLGRRGARKTQFTALPRLHGGRGFESRRPLHVKLADLAAGYLRVLRALRPTCGLRSNSRPQPLTSPEVLGSIVAGAESV